MEDAGKKSIRSQSHDKIHMMVDAGGLVNMGEIRRITTRSSKKDEEL